MSYHHEDANNAVILRMPHLWPCVRNKNRGTGQGIAFHWYMDMFPDSKVPWANMGPIWGRQDPGGPHVGPMNFVIWVIGRRQGQWSLSVGHLEANVSGILNIIQTFSEHALENVVGKLATISFWLQCVKPWVIFHWMVEEKKCAWFIKLRLAFHWMITSTDVTYRHMRNIAYGMINERGSFEPMLHDDVISWKRLTSLAICDGHHGHRWIALTKDQ